VLRLALRETEGLIGSVIRLLGFDLPEPDHTTLSRRADGLDVLHPPSRGGANGMHLIVGSSGLQFHGTLVHGSAAGESPVPTRVSVNPGGGGHIRPHHSVEHIAPGFRLGLLVGQSPGLKPPADDGLVAKHRRLNQTSSIVT
jgi:Transposase DDE domain